MCCWNSALEEINSIIILLLLMPITHAEFDIMGNSLTHILKVKCERF